MKVGLLDARAKVVGTAQSTVLYTNPTAAQRVFNALDCCLRIAATKASRMAVIDHRCLISLSSGLCEQGNYREAREKALQAVLFELRYVERLVGQELAGLRKTVNL